MFMALPKFMDFTQLTLGQLLSHPSPIIKRNATSILKQLQRGKNEVPVLTANDLVMAISRDLPKYHCEYCNLPFEDKAEWLKHQHNCIK
jgi:hypothetical protein